MKTSYLIIGVIAISTIVGIILAVNNNNNEKEAGALVPYVDIEASIVSLSLDESGDYMEGDEIISAPSDTAIVKIEKITGSGGDYEFDWSSLNIEEGKQVSLNFGYGARPAKVITVVGETTSSNGVVSHQIFPTEITFEDNYFIFKVNDNSETETILPGLEEGSKFRARIWQPLLQEELSVGRYEIIS